MVMEPSILKFYIWNLMKVELQTNEGFTYVTLELVWYGQSSVPETFTNPVLRPREYSQ